MTTSCWNILKKTVGIMIVHLSKSKFAHNLLWTTYSMNICKMLVAETGSRNQGISEQGSSEQGSSEKGSREKGRITRKQGIRTIQRCSNGQGSSKRGNRTASTSKGEQESGGLNLIKGKK